MEFRRVKVKIKKLNNLAKLPVKGSEGAAAYDLYATENVYIAPESVAKVSTGLSFEIPEGWKGEVYSRSGLAKDGVVVANCPGKIDSDYRGEVFVLLHNINQHVIGILAGDRIAQFEVNPVHSIDFEEEEELTETERGEGGFGSTGTR